MAQLALVAESVGDRRAMLREQLLFLVDEYHELEYVLQQRLWLKSECPMCLKLKAMGRAGPCLLCDQVDRSNAEDEGDDAPFVEQAHPRTRKNTARVRVFVDYQIAPSSRVKGKRHGTGATRAEWQCRLTMDLPIPATMAAVAAFGDELADRFRDEVHAQPFRTMQ